jgi:hypothetical protein
MDRAGDYDYSVCLRQCEDRHSSPPSPFPIINHDLTIGPTTTVVTALRELVLQRLTDSRGLPKYAQDITFVGSVVGWKIRATDS